MSVVVTVNLCVALKTHWDGVVDVVGAAFIRWDNMVRFDLYTAESVADTTSPVTPNEQN
jgi:hypothetical protein